VLFAVGAQGTKFLGIEGERLPGVYHAKDLVYHYNRLPPFSEREFAIGSRVAIVGVGNVMIDVANYCIHFRQCEEVIAVARRGPFEKAYDDKEFEDVEDAFDRACFRREIERVRSRLEAVGQEPAALLGALEAREAPAERARTLLRFRFLSSPTRILPDGGRVAALEVEETRLERRGDRIAAVGTGETCRIPCDTVVFAVGDRVDESLGLPFADGLYLTAPGAPDDPAAAYRAWDPGTRGALDGVFLVGWARRASDGVVGRARLDAETGVRHVLAYLADRPRRAAARADRLIARVRQTLEARGTRVVTYADVRRIEAEERGRAEAAGLPEFKFASDREMLALLDR
jgi:ferredoxin--NADP+ reductase